VKLALAAAVFDSVNRRYAQLAEELLGSVRKTESSLKRLKKGRAPDGGGGADAGGGAAEMNDSDKICLQLYLDAQEHGRLATRFGLQAEAAPSFSALLAAVTPQQQPAGAFAGPGSGGGVGEQGAPAAPGVLLQPQVHAGPGELQAARQPAPLLAYQAPLQQPLYQQQPQQLAPGQPPGLGGNQPSY
jgi:hypothetical protein